MEILKEELKKKSESTSYTYLYFNSKFLDFCKKSYEQVTVDDINSYLAFLAEKQSNNTIKVAFSAMKFFYDSILKKNFFSSIKIPKSKRQDFLTKEEIEKLVNSAKTEKSKLIIKMLCFFKPSEIVELKKSDIEGLPEMFREAVKSKVGASEYIFQGRKGMMSIRNIQKILSMAAKKAGLGKKVTPYILRRSK